ncbi:Uma2 family endonuclease [Fimbriiglobus ruber]|uniref:Putative restriction endonuclease domain-containing protein n=1 Tax=Fimbriiglobus ruber TaxID=1908690 RepID=A0A225EF87_9BACT|nr:Uma2 family endonuclease [Fimbriiglobus ruber]OWK46907.1 hypothetical protein FRUB_00606 [Fimbriiglobus ruber]
MSPTELEMPLDWIPGLPRAEDLPYEDGEPMDTFWHLRAMNLLIECIEQHFQGRKDFFVGGNMFMYFSPKMVFNRDFRGPDFFYVNGAAHDKSRPSWVVWEEEGKFPNVIVELTSPTTKKVDLTTKKTLYAQTFRTPEYYCYDPDGSQLVGWRLYDGNYEPIEPEGGRLWSSELELYLGPWESEFQTRTEVWLRFFDASGNVILTFDEAAKQRIEVEKQRVKVEKQRTDVEKQRADVEKQRADSADAELARLRAEIEAIRRQPPTQ